MGQMGVGRAGPERGCGMTECNGLEEGRKVVVEAAEKEEATR